MIIVIKKFEIGDKVKYGYGAKSCLGGQIHQFFGNIAIIRLFPESSKTLDLEFAEVHMKDLYHLMDCPNYFYES